jgi:hypothetical protein
MRWRPIYAQPGGTWKSRICRKLVCPSQIEALKNRIQKGIANPPVFDLLTINGPDCSEVGCQLLGGLTPGPVTAFPNNLTGQAAAQGWDCKVGVTHIQTNGTFTLDP